MASGKPWQDAECESLPYDCLCVALWRNAFLPSHGASDGNAASNGSAAITVLQAIASNATRLVNAVRFEILIGKL